MFDNICQKKVHHVFISAFLEFTMTHYMCMLSFKRNPLLLYLAAHNRPIETTRAGIWYNHGGKFRAYRSL